jgi:hypothetical protein
MPLALCSYLGIAVDVTVVGRARNGPITRTCKSSTYNVKSIEYGYCLLSREERCWSIVRSISCLKELYIKWYTKYIKCDNS